MVEEDKNSKLPDEGDIVRLEANDPRYYEKLGKLKNDLNAAKNALELKRKQLKKLLEKAKKAQKILQKAVNKDPRNFYLKAQLQDADLALDYLQRARSDVVKIKVELKDETARVNASAEFKQPIDIEIKSIPDIEHKIPDEKTMQTQGKKSQQTIDTYGKQKKTKENIMALRGIENDTTANMTRTVLRATNVMAYQVAKTLRKSLVS